MMSSFPVVKDELMTTKKSYDAQLMTMSEALASMNGNLAGQQDEIEELKLQLKVSLRLLLYQSVTVTQSTAALAIFAYI